MSKSKLSVIGVYDADQQNLAAVFKSGSESDQKDAAQDYVDRIHLHTGDAPERNLYVVEVKEV